jgi:membrane-associated phospholipid phosphatase
MTEVLFQLDRAVFQFINQTLANPVTDIFMPVITNDNFLRAVYVILVAALLIRGRSQMVWVIAFTALVLAATDLTSSAVLKPLFVRPRPCQIMPVHLLVSCGSGYSFPSSHAANLFGQAFFLGLLYKKYLPISLVFAFFVALSRISVGVHYPLDMLGGMITGSLIGMAAARVMIKLNRMGRLKPQPDLGGSGRR